MQADRDTIVIGTECGKYQSQDYLLLTQGSKI